MEYNIKDYSVKQLQDALKSMKSSGSYSGKINTLKKKELFDNLKNVSYNFSQLSVKGKKEIVPYRKYGSIAKAVEKYQKSGNTQLEKAIKTEKRNKSAKKINKSVKKPKVEGPSLARGMTYTRLQKKYIKEGNKQIEDALKLEAERLNAIAQSIPQIQPKKRGRPKKKAE